MSVQINGINVIDDDRNFSAAGIVTVGTGNSATIIDGTTGITSVGIGITLEGVPGNISIAGTITAAGFNIPANIVSFSPVNGATGVSAYPINTTIDIFFDQAVGIATTGTIQIREGSTVANSTLQQTIGVDNILATQNGIKIQLNETLGFEVIHHPVIPNGFIKSTSGDFVGLNTTGADTYSFTTSPPVLGVDFEGGYLICRSGGTNWVVAPSSTEACTFWNGRNTAVTNANAYAACGDWFIPSCGQLKNPGVSCKTYWDSYSNTSNYWSNTQVTGNQAWNISMSDSNARADGIGDTQQCVRAFRTVTY
jgi:hypothetical protein